LRKRKKEKERERERERERKRRGSNLHGVLSEPTTDEWR
jgi:hypothetical protein